MILIDHQPFQFAGLRSHDSQTVINNVVGLAKTAKVFGVPTLLTTVMEQRGGYLIKQLQDVFPEQKPINRTFINTWEDSKVTHVVKKSGRKQLLLAGLFTEICVAMPAIQAVGEGYDVFVVIDACAGVTAEAHDMAIRRMIQVGVVPITWAAVLGEWQRDWARSPDFLPLLRLRRRSFRTRVRPGCLPRRAWRSRPPGSGRARLGH